VPELPDVEAARRSFARHAGGRRVASVIVADPAIVRNVPAEALDDALRGRTFAAPRRHGKWLLCWTDGPALLLHFGMTGELVSSADEPTRHRWDRVVIELADGSEIRYRDMRRLGGVWLAHGSDDARAVVGRLGPDALTVGRAEFLERLARRRGGVKAALLDQTFVAGVGNLLADEILWRSRLHPRRRVETLAGDERARLHRAIRLVASRWVERYDDILRMRSWLTPVRGVPGATCPRCRTPLERVAAAGRTTWFCPSCQPQRATG
jgi:formamidopyrimidine-DNA glycosylase